MDLTEADRAALRDSGFGWDTAYGLGHDGEVYTALRLGTPHRVITADTTGELRAAIRSDYFAWMAGLRERMST
jgi:hypothetical protein